MVREGIDADDEVIRKLYHRIRGYASQYTVLFVTADALNKPPLDTTIAFACSDAEKDKGATECKLLKQRQ